MTETTVEIVCGLIFVPALSWWLYLALFKGLHDPAQPMLPLDRKL
jgi:hypothetical protein